MFSKVKTKLFVSKSVNSPKKIPKFGTGGCKVACENEAENQEKTKFNYYALSQCSLSWSVEPEKQNIVFILAGEDLGGMINNIHSSLVTTRWGHKI